MEKRDKIVMKIKVKKKKMEGVIIMKIIIAMKNKKWRIPKKLLKK